MKASLEQNGKIIVDEIDIVVTHDNRFEFRMPFEPRVDPDLPDETYRVVYEDDSKLEITVVSSVIFTLEGGQHIQIVEGYVRRILS